MLQVLAANFTMKTLFCWRCQMEMPMLDETEYAIIADLYAQGFLAAKEFHQQNTLSVESDWREKRFRPLLEKYREMTGFEETEPNAVMHHRIVLYGPPCTRCAKLLRSPQAAFCAECGQIVD